MPQDTLLEAYLPEDIAHPPEAYFEAMRRLRLEPPDEETVERIMEIFREYWRRQDSKVASEPEGAGGAAHQLGTLGASANRFRTYRARRRS